MSLLAQRRKARASAGREIEVDISIAEAKALSEMLTVNKSLRIIHLPANFCDCSPIVSAHRQIYTRNGVGCVCISQNMCV